MAHTDTPLLHSIVLGQGRPLVIMHGFLGMADNWITLGRRWARDGLEVHLLDLRNHGKSFRDDRFDYDVLTEDLDRYIRHYHLDHPHILGHSLGGKIAMFDAIGHPENRGKYVVLDIAPKYYPPRHEFIFKGLREVDPGKYTSRQEVDRALRPYIPQDHIRRFVMKNLQRTSKGNFRWKLNREVLEKSMEAIGRALPEDAVSLKEILFLKGSLSDYIGAEDYRMIEEIFPLAVIGEIPGAGHWLHAEQPDMVYEMVLDFLMN